MGFGPARYGATILGFSNTSPCVLNVDSSQFFQIGDPVRVANVVNTSTGPSINGDYLVTALTNNTITIDEDTSSFGSYISGGFLTILQQVNPNPINQSNLNIPLIPWVVFNQAIGTGLPVQDIPEIIPDYYNYYNGYLCQ